MADGSQPGWEDITQLLTNAATELRVGEMVHVPEFNLRDVMSAVEAMDPKVDGGYHLIGTRTLDELEAAGEILQSPSDTQVVEIIDHLVQCEMTWYTGRALPQTIYRCIYAHRFSLLRHTVLLAYLKALLRGVLYVIRAVERVDIKEEEEFVTATFMVLSPDQLETDAVLKNLDEAVAELQSRVSQQTEEGKVAAALLERLSFRRSFLLALQILDTGNDKELAAAREALSKALQHHVQAASQRKALGATPSPPPGAFTSLSTKWVNTPSPIRDIDLLSWQQTDEHLRKAVADLQRVCDLPEYTTLPRLLQFLHSFSARSSLPPARAFLLIVLRTQQFSLVPKLLESLDKDFGAPFYQRIHSTELAPSSESTNKKKGEKPKDEKQLQLELQKHHLEVWVQRAGAVFWTIVHALCCNRSRLRRRLANAFPDFGALQQAAWEADLALGATEKYGASYFLSHFTYDLILQNMNLFLLLGFELDLYKNWEYQPMLWYLDFLCRSRLDNSGLLYKTQDHEDKQPRSRQGSVAARRRRNADEPEVLASRRIMQPPATSVCITECYALLTRALFRLIASLLKQNVEVCPAVQNPLTSQAMTYEHRLLPFLHLTRPQYIRWDTYAAHSDTSAHPAETLLESALELFSRCKQTIEHTILARGCNPEEQEEFNMLTKVAKGNALTGQLFKSLTASGSQLYADFDYTFSAVLPVIKVKKGARPKVDREDTK